MTAESSQDEITDLLLAWGNGDRAALDRLMPVVYQELHRLAKVYLSRERADHTLQPTALIHEAYLKLFNRQKVDWKNRAHFFGVAAHVMRSVLCDYARARQADKRGEGAPRLSLNEAIETPQLEASVDILALEEALNRLAALDTQKSRLVELRFFAGLSIEQTADVLGVSVPTVVRQWRVAKAFLKKEMKSVSV